MTIDQIVHLPPLIFLRLISDFGEVTEIQGEVIRNDTSASGSSSIGIKFLNVTDLQHQSLIRQMYSSPTSWDNAYQGTSTTWRSLVLLASSSIRAFIKDNILKRISPRVRKNLICELIVEGRAFKGNMEDLSNTGISVRMVTDEILSDKAEIHLYHDGRIVFSVRGEIIRFEKMPNREVLYGLRFLEHKDLQLSSLR